MKRVLLSSIPILGMAYDRKYVRSKAESKSEQIRDHVLKCFLYPDNQSYDHWIQEIGAFLASVNSYKVKPKGSKLKAREYVETTFSAFGEDEQDAEAMLYDFYSDFTQKRKYGDFEITAEMISNLNDLSRQLENTISGMLADNSATYTMQDFSSSVRSILSTYVRSINTLTE